MVNNQDKFSLFKEKINVIYKEKANQILSSISKGRYETFRINSNLANPTQVLVQLSGVGLDIVKGPFENSYINMSSFEGKKVSESEAFKNGSLYVQGLGSMLGTIVLNPLHGEKIIDLCASPGSKTSQMCSLGSDPKDIWAVENNSNRFFSLMRNLETQGYGNVNLIKTNASGIAKTMPQYVGFFDKVLADVPCSNEGNVRLNTLGVLEYWRPGLVKHIPMLQKKILASGYHLLKKGGILVYSTCTYSVEENEEVADWALRKFSDLKLLEIQLPKNQKTDNFLSGFTEFKNKTFSSDIKKTLRILPNEYYDGFFVTRFVKESRLL